MITVGIAVGVSGNEVAVEYEGGAVEQVTKLKHVTVASGDLVHLVRSGQSRFVDGVLGRADRSDLLEGWPADPGETGAGVWVATPDSPGSWSDGGWRDDTTLLYQGAWGGQSIQTGAAWYGLGPSSLPGVLVAGVLVLLRVAGDPEPVAPTLTLYEGLERGTEPVIVAATLGPSLPLDTITAWPIPPYWLTRLGDGRAGGIGCRTGNRAPALALTTAQTGMTLTLNWEDTQT